MVVLHLFPCKLLSFIYQPTWVQRVSPTLTPQHSNMHTLFPFPCCSSQLLWVPATGHIMLQFKYVTFTPSDKLFLFPLCPLQELNANTWISQIMLFTPLTFWRIYIGCHLCCTDVLPEVGVHSPIKERHGPWPPNTYSLVWKTNTSLNEKTNNPENKSRHVLRTWGQLAAGMRAGGYTIWRLLRMKHLWRGREADPRTYHCLWNWSKFGPIVFTHHHLLHGKEKSMP